MPFDAPLIWFAWLTANAHLWAAAALGCGPLLRQAFRNRRVVRGFARCCSHHVLALGAADPDRRFGPRRPRRCRSRWLPLADFASLFRLIPRDAVRGGDESGAAMCARYRRLRAFCAAPPRFHPLASAVASRVNRRIVVRVFRNVFGLSPTPEEAAV
ncbi:MAG TPA: hypothetical protein VD866_14390, partial [Urbifossiella sp.]|nr:hypothetical protein [Urbifossiella sp.]